MRIFTELPPSDGLTAATSPFRGERVPVGRWCEPFSAVASVVAGRAPPGHSNRADRRERQGFCYSL